MPMESRTPQSWLPPLPPRDGYPATEPPAPPSPERSLLKRLIGPLFVAGLVVLKFGAKLKALLLLLPKLKLLTTSASMLVSVAAYALIWGWRFAAGFVALLFVHEMGHYVQMRREGVQPSFMLFIPFLGAAVGARSLGGNALAEARIGLAGPVLGTLGTAALIPVAEASGSDLLRALAFVGFFLNLFNLVPVLPLDGGRAMAAMAPWMWFVGFGAMVAMVLVFPNPILFLVILFGGMETWRRWKHRRSGEEGNEAYYRVRPAHRLLVGAVYVGLIAACAIGMDATFVDRSDRL
jgi:Zn-dependent protease